MERAGHRQSATTRARIAKGISAGILDLFEVVAARALGSPAAARRPGIARQTGKDVKYLWLRVSEEELATLRYGLREYRMMTIKAAATASGRGRGVLKAR